MQQKQKQYWFPRRRSGLGWGIPNVWQGWAALAVYAALLVGGNFLFRPGPESGPLMIYISVCSALLIFVGWLKGEPPL